MKSSWQQYLHQPDGSITLEGRPELAIEVIEEQGRATGRNIEAELGLPKFFEEWEAMAQPRGLSGRRIQFIALDESETRFPGHYRFQPRRITLPNACHLEFGHRGFLVGIVHPFLLCFDELCALTHSLSGIELPKEMKSDYIIADATLFDSPLADKAWDALRLGIFTHVCPLVARMGEEPAGTGQLVEVSLVAGDYPGCPGAKILKMWDTGA
jgi:hypothetical protein